MKKLNPFSGQHLFMIIILLLFTFYAVSFSQNKADPPPSRFKAEINSFVKWDLKNSFPANSILFVGSSSIRLWQTAKEFPDLHVINRGFGGAHISDINFYIDSLVIKYKPKIIVFYAGDNDIAAGKSPEHVFEDYQEFVKIINRELSYPIIIFLPIKPSPARWELWPLMDETNHLIKDFSNIEMFLYYVDTAIPMLDADGQPRKDIFIKDGLHLNNNGYQLWNKILTPQLEKAILKADGKRQRMLQHIEDNTK